MAGSVTVYVHGVPVTLEAGASLLEACDAAGRYVPRLCNHPALGTAGATAGPHSECGLCLVRVGAASPVLACNVKAREGDRVITDDPELSTLRAERLARLLARHPHVCLSCPERDGCARDQCAYGNPPEARCCEHLGRCEFGRLVAFVDPETQIPRRAVAVSRAATVEGHIRREPGLCVACGRCVRICGHSTEAGDSLELAAVARPKRGTLRESGCTFCGLCVLVCPTGAVTAPGAAGATWSASRRERHHLPAQVLPPVERKLQIPEDLPALPPSAGVFALLDVSGQVLRIGGVPDLAQGVRQALREPMAAKGVWFKFEVEPLYTQRETEMLSQFARDHGHLPEGNDLGGDLFADDLD